MRVVLTGGCTGGHIYPALAIGDKFRERDPECEVIYIAHAHGMETTIVPAAGYDLKIVTADWVRRDKPIKMIKTLLNTLKGRREALRIIREFKPDVIMSTGSFVSVPAVLAGHAYGAKIFMHEQNGFPGVSNRAFAKYATKIFLGFESAREYFKEKDKIIYSGNPVRRDFYGRNRAEDRKAMEINDDSFVITVFGGSLGSGTTNKIGEALIREFGGREGYTVIFGTGKMYYENVCADLNAKGLADMPNVRVMPYIKDMPAFMSASDLVISRAGALSVAEVTMSGRAAIFVPSSNVTADHQYYNAKAVADNGGALIVRDTETAAPEVMELVRELDNDRDRIIRMEKASFELAPAQAADIIYDTIMESFR